MKTEHKRAIYTTLLLTLLISGCQNAEVSKEQLAASNTESIASQDPTFIGILQHPQDYVGKDVSVQGVFAGWSGSCHGQPPKTRSDWMLESGNTCLYVSGKSPKGTSARPPAKGIGKKIIVSGKVVLDAQQRPYIEVE